jgi:sugar O-acyltransferase (sialic acid O-acetyltransferase NeuD family)
MLTELLLVGAGGHAKVVYDAIVAANLSASVRVLDEDPRRSGERFFDLGIEAPNGSLSELPKNVHVAVGDNCSRRDVCERMAGAGKKWVVVIHPRAHVSARAEVRGGAFVAALAAVAPSAVVETCAIVNHGAIVDHDCIVGPWAHVAPNATLGGGVKIGAGALIGAGCVVLPGVTVGDWAVVGAGAVVTRPVPDRQVVVGVPAKGEKHARRS